MIYIDDFYFEPPARLLREFIQRGLRGAPNSGDNVPAAIQVFLGQSQAKSARRAYKKKSFTRIYHGSPFTNIFSDELGERRLSRQVRNSISWDTAEDAMNTLYLYTGRHVTWPAARRQDTLADKRPRWI
jgi:hypothetical protein